MRYLTIIILLLCSDPLWAATIWVNPTGSATLPYDTKAKGLTTIQAGTGAMSAGDTLIIADGTYQGASNMIDYEHRMPNGSAGAYTTVRAETVGGVIIDGQGVRNPLTLEHNPTLSYVIIQGICFANGDGVADANCRIGYSDHVKLLDCSAYDAHAGSHGISIHNSTYVLFERCWVWGQFMYGLHTRSNQYSVMRQCVVRHDRLDTSTGGELSAAYFNYETDYSEFQNCIAIDADRSSYLVPSWGEAAYWQFYDGNNSSENHDVYYRGCIAINHMGDAMTHSETDTSVFLSDCVFWGSLSADIIYQKGLGDPELSANHMTVGGCSVDSARAMYASGGTAGSVTNSIFAHITGTALYNLTSANYICLYGNNTNSNGVTPTNSITTVDPLAASLLYLPRIEAGSDLITAGLAGTYVGAQVVYKMGTDGTLYGDTGYATITANSLWPFPNEAAIKEAMAAYTYDDGGGGDPEITGARGFCATGKQLNGTDDITLTSYIWEYLGNQIPSDIYGSGSITSSTRSGVSSFGVSSY